VKYRQSMGLRSREVLVGMTSAGFSITDPKDPGMLDVVGCDTATPGLIADFRQRSVNMTPDPKESRVNGWG
jgi:60 kDa SS-A/Ro ribonucleoprotein